MRRILSTIMLATLAIVAAPDAAAVYHPEMAEFSEMLNKEAAGDGCTVSYDGTNIIMDFPSTFFSGDEADLFASMDDLQPLAPVMVQVLSQSMGADNVQTFGSLFEMYDTNLVMRLNLGSTTKEIIITPAQLLGK